MFSTLWKSDVGGLIILDWPISLTIRQHNQKKRHIAGQYANTNIMRPDNLKGIEERAQAFLKKCLETNASQGDTDVYVRKLP